MPIRRAKGTGSVQKKGSKYYFRIKINGKEIVRRMPEVSSDKEADLEATRLYTIASAKTKEEIGFFCTFCHGIPEPFCSQAAIRHNWSQAPYYSVCQRDSFRNPFK
jgi:hypothetical protein